jgi:uncharacterized membrane protein YjjP (DUF1212 family)
VPIFAVLARLHELAAAEKELLTHQTSLRDALADMKAIAAASKEYKKWALLFLVL